ncbi:MAG TPA: hypothetical protein VHP83_18515 [Aggregatilineaceae bacterium]|nr:hypothetical protein [Aggregatilineaceae bacterium]
MNPDSDPLLAVLRQGLEVWEEEIAAYWSSVTRSPDFLRRVGHQINESLRAQQQMVSALQTALSQPGEQEIILLQRLTDQLTRLAARIDQLERALDDR